MEQITKYKATDGKEFTEAEDCVDYENMILEIDDLMSVLPKRPEDIDFTNGMIGFVQHDPLILRMTKQELLKIIKAKINHKWVQQNIDDETMHESYIGRLLSDYGIEPLSNAWFRFSCIDKRHREWGQPYYAAHPDEGIQICINTDKS